MRLPPPSADAFYEAVPDPPPPGMVIRHREPDSAVGAEVQLHQVVYGSRGEGGRPTTVSGTVLLPPTAWLGPGPRPILSYGVGLHGLGRDCAPSWLLADGREAEWPLLRLALRHGWAIAVTDGVGLGLPGPHTYGAARPGAHAMLDVVRAATRMDLGLSATAPVVLWGYSEGGRYAAWAAALQPSYAGELALAGAAVGGVPADLYAVARAIDAGPYSGLGLAVLVGLATAHDDPRLWDILSPRGRRAAQRAAELDGGRLVAAYPQPIARHTVRDEPWDDPVWRAVLASERAGGSAPAVPTYHYHVPADEIVPFTVGRALADEYRAHGGDVTWVEVRARDHLGGAVAGATGAVRWLHRRMAAAEAVRLDQAG